MKNPTESTPEAPVFVPNLPSRQRLATILRNIFWLSTFTAIIFLLMLLYNVVNPVAGYVAIENRVEPESLAVNGVPLEELDRDTLIGILQANTSAGRFRRLDADQPFSERSWGDVYTLVQDEVVRPKVVRSWKITESIFNKSQIDAELAEIQATTNPNARLEYKVWLNLNFLRSPQSSNPETAGIRTAILGSLYVVFVTIAFSFPVGVSAAVYLEEYALDNWINRLIRTNINNLAGVPSIIYGILGLAIFVRTFEAFTSGAMFGVGDAGTTLNGRTIVSAGLTLGLLILPLIIINSQEAIRSVPASLRQASYGLGATKWQTIWHHVLPNAIPGILTGTILAMSRALGETAPLVVVGASTYITFDPEGFFSKFTVLPIQIYQWTSRPQDVFRNIAASAIVVILVLLILLNATAIFLRNRYSQKKF